MFEIKSKAVRFTFYRKQAAQHFLMLEELSRGIKGGVRHIYKSLFEKQQQTCVANQH